MCIWHQQQPPIERGWHLERPPAALRRQRPPRHQRLDGHPLPQRSLQRIQGRQLQGNLTTPSSDIIR